MISLLKTCHFSFQSFLYLFTLLLSITSDEEKATKQSELGLLMDEVERAQTRLLTLEREKVFHRMFFSFFKCHV